MQDHPLDHRGAVAPDVVEHLDLVTAELRRRIAGIGLAIAELREETGRLRASADGRYHAVSVLDRPTEPGPAGVVDVLADPPQPSLIEPASPASHADVSGDLRFAPAVAEPVSPWGDPIVEVAPAPVEHVDPAPVPVAAADAAMAAFVEPVSSPDAPSLTGSTLTWVPEPVAATVVTPPVMAPVVEVAGVAPVVVAPAVVTSSVDVAAPVEGPQDADAELPAAPTPLWGDGDDEDSAAFEAFFSAEIEPEPSQRWLLSD